MFGSIIAGLGFVVAGVVAFVLAVVTLVRGLLIPGRYAGARCGSCGHAVEFGQRGDNCPECGKSFTEVGVVTRALAARFRAGPLALHCSWLFICTSLLVVASYIVMIASLASMGMMGGAMATMTTTATVTPAAAATYELDIEIDSATGVGGGDVMRAAVVVAGVPSPIRMEALGPTGAWVLLDGTETEVDAGPQLDAAAFEALLTAAGIELTAERLEEAALLAERSDAAMQDPMLLGSYLDGSLPASAAASPGSAASVLVSRPTGPQPLLVTATGSSFGGMGPGFMTSGMVGTLIAVGVMLLVYIAGVVFIESRRRKLTGGRRAM